MNVIVQKTAQLLGVDKAIAYTSSNGIVSALIGVFSVFIYATCLSKEEQGYYYTFGSVMAIQVFFELGFTGIMTQYVAHEHAHLTWAEDGVNLLGESTYRSRLSSLLHFCVKWYSVIAVLYLIVLQIVGYSFFSKFGTNYNVSWKIPWILLSCLSAWGLFQAPFFSFMSGLGLVKDMAKMGFYRTILSTLVLWVCLISGLSLYSMAISGAASTLFVLFYYISHKFIKIILSIWRTEIKETVSYMKEIFPFQWKIALSWISGYFIFNFINPVIFATDGPIAAGQMGMTIGVLNSIRGFAMSWIGTKVPLMSRLIELKEYCQLDKLFKRTVIQEVAVGIVLLILFWCVVFGLRYTQFSVNGRIIGERFLDYVPLLLMTIPVIAQMVNDNFATYLRCHKKEPFLLQSICVGILSIGYILTAGKIWGLMGICVGYCFIFTVVGLPWGYAIFVNKKRAWHKE